MIETQKLPSVLVVDDSKTDRAIIGGLLTDSKRFAVEYAANGADALQYLKDHTPQLVLTDLVMPGLDGLGLVAKMVEQYPQVPVMLITGQGSEELAVKALHGGAAGYIAKANAADRLVDAVSGVVAMARAEQSRQALLQCLTESDCCYVLKNDPGLFPPLLQDVQRNVRLIGVCDETDGFRICVALEEALNNALFHGNLELASAERHADPAAHQREVIRRLSTDVFGNRRIRVRARISPDSAAFTVEDDGPGFDPYTLPDPTVPENLEKPNGRGVLLMRTFMDEVHFSERGNRVDMVKRASVAHCRTCT